MALSQSYRGPTSSSVRQNCEVASSSSEHGKSDERVRQTRMDGRTHGRAAAGKQLRRSSVGYGATGIDGNTAAFTSRHAGASDVDGVGVRKSLRRVVMQTRCSPKTLPEKWPGSPPDSGCHAAASSRRSTREDGDC